MADRLAGRAETGDNPVGSSLKAITLTEDPHEFHNVSYGATCAIMWKTTGLI